MFLAFIAMLGMGALIGWTMATTPPPKPIEEFIRETEKIEQEGRKESEEQ